MLSLTGFRSALASRLPHAPTVAALAALGLALTAPAAMAVPKSATETTPVTEPPPPTPNVRIFARASASSSLPGAFITDTVTVTGTTGLPGFIQGFILGPMPSRSGYDCDSINWGGARGIGGFGPFEANGDGTYVSPPIQAPEPGCYGIRVSWQTADHLFGDSYLENERSQNVWLKVSTTPTKTPTTPVIPPTPDPKITTVVSASSSRPGATLIDAITLTGTAGLSGTIYGAILGPMPSRSGYDCGTIRWGAAMNAGYVGPFDVKGDGTFMSEGVVAPGAGCYTFTVMWTSTNHKYAAVSYAGEDSETVWLQVSTTSPTATPTTSTLPTIRPTAVSVPPSSTATGVAAARGGPAGGYGPPPVGGIDAGGAAARTTASPVAITAGLSLSVFGLIVGVVALRRHRRPSPTATIQG